MHGYRDAVLTGVGRYIREQSRRWRPIIADFETDDLANQLSDWRGDGILYSATNDRMINAIGQRRGRVPAVNLSGGRDTFGRSVVSDNRAVGAMAADHLLEHALPRYAYVGGAMSYAVERREGFLVRIHEAGGTCEVFDSARSAFTGLRRLLEEARPIGIFAADDALAITLIQRVVSSGIVIPRDLAVVGAGNWKALCELGSPTLSSVDVDFESRGYAGAAMLDELIAGKKPVGPVLIPPRELVARESSAVFGYADPTLRKAVEFIAANSETAISVTHVAAAAGVSRRKLEQVFTATLGRTIHDEIWRRRIVCARRLLSGTELSMLDIAKRCGFSSASSFSTTFQRHTGRSPREYRLQESVRRFGA